MNTCSKKVKLRDNIRAAHRHNEVSILRDVNNTIFGSYSKKSTMILPFDVTHKTIDLYFDWLIGGILEISLRQTIGKLK